MRIIKNLSLKGKLTLILLLLIIPLSYFSINTLLIEQQRAYELEKTHDKLQDTWKISEILHHFQKERALSLGYYFSKGKGFGKRLSEQRVFTDKAIEKLGVLNTDEGKLLQASFSTLSVKRSEIDALQIDSLQFEAYFNDVVLKLSKQLELNSIEVSDSEAKVQLDAYLDFSKAKYNLGAIRTILTRVIPKGEVNVEDVAFISSKKSLFDSYKENFLQTASPSILKFYQEKASTPTSNVINNFIVNDLLKGGKNIKSQDLNYWYDMFTSQVDILKDVETFAIKQIEKDLATKRIRAERRVIYYTSFVVVMFILAIWLSLSIIRNLLLTVNALKKAADQVAEGETHVKLPMNSKDEMGALANSFRTVVEKNTHLAEVAKVIGQGNYEVDISVASEKDVLSNALLKMKDNLKLLSEQEKKRTWILTGNTEINDLISRDREISSVAEKIISHTCNYINAELGAFYLLNDHLQLELASSYAYVPKEVKPEHFNSSKNLIGQALKNRRLLKLEQVKVPEFKIETGFIAVDPAEVLIIPLYLQDQPVGVFELASRKPFSADKVEYLERISEKIAAILIALKADIKTTQLLAETQTQAEELEAQQEELRQVNIQLISQKDKLQQSEEELRVNQEELEEKNAELEEKAKLLEEHYEAITLKNDELEEARQSIQLQVEELQRVGKYKSEFLANMSHELRTPLNSILILAKLISENRDSNLTPKQVEFAEVIHNSGNDLLKLINEILDLAKIEAGKLSLEIDAFSLRELNPEILFAEVAREKDIEFEIDFKPGLPEKITSDKFRLEQILKNLLSNAFKFTPEGGKVSFEVFLPDNKKEFSNPALNAASTVIGFSVKDTGIGISKNDLKVIFEAFRQADSSTTRKFGGTGLGLSISKELANLLGGEIIAESTVGEGSKFTFYIPDKFSQVEEAFIEQVVVPQLKRDRDDAKSIFSKTEKLFTPGKENTILIIEDDKGFAKILADFAEGKKIKPVTTHFGLKGLELMRRIKPDAVLLDIQLPDVSGWEVLEKIKQDDSIRHIPVHVMTAYQLDPSQKGVSKENYLPKPITLENLDKAFTKIQSMGDGFELKKVLIIEDNEVEGNAVKELLLAHGMKSSIAHSGEEAFTLMVDQTFDCIILDMSMPGMSGYEVLEKLKASSDLKNIPVIIYSGKDFSEDEEFRLKKYANAIVIKTDYSYKRLLDEVKLFLHKMQDKLPAFEPGKIYRADESLKGKKVLVVDDDSRNIYSLYNAFEAEEMNIIVGNNGIEALDKLSENPDVDIILMDIMMPEMDGLECTRVIRTKNEFSQIPIIALTAKAMKEDKEKCIEAGASDYITKPVNVEKLLSLMRVWLHRKEHIKL